MSYKKKFNPADIIFTRSIKHMKKNVSKYYTASNMLINGKSSTKNLELYKMSCGE